jgi:hypothetical protein
MTEDRIEVGPVDFLVVEFAVGQANFSDETMRELAHAVDAGTIRLLDLLVLTKESSGLITASEIDDLDGFSGTDGAGVVRRLVAEIAEILTAKDLAHLAAAMQPGSTAGVVVWENRWATPFATAAREAGGMVVATGGISTAAVADSIDADALDVDLVEVASTLRLDTLPSPGRAHRRGVITAPVARSASTVAAATIVDRGVVRRRADRRARRGPPDGIAHNG